MNIANRVKSRLSLLAAVLLPLATFSAEPPPDAKELLRQARMAQANLDLKFNGHLRVGAGSKKIPFILTIADGIVRYEFQDTKDTITLRMGAKESRLEETKGGKTEKITAAKFDDSVRDTSITYEDLAMRFLYWPDAKVVGEDKILVQSAWVVEIKPPAGTPTQYSKVKAYFSQNDRSLLKMQGLDANGREIRAFTARGAMKEDGMWYLKTMEIRLYNKMRNATFLELDDVIKK
jgi:hypothetical protein